MLDKKDDGARLDPFPDFVLRQFAAFVIEHEELVPRPLPRPPLLDGDELDDLLDLVPFTHRFGHGAMGKDDLVELVH